MRSNYRQSLVLRHWLKKSRSCLDFRDFGNYNTLIAAKKRYVVVCAISHNDGTNLIFSCSIL